LIGVVAFVWIVDQHKFYSVVTSQLAAGLGKVRNDYSIVIWDVTQVN
jgi:hypothetical protein